MRIFAAVWLLLVCALWLHGCGTSSDVRSGRLKIKHSHKCSISVIGSANTTAESITKELDIDDDCVISSEKKVNSGR